MGLTITLNEISVIGIAIMLLVVASIVIIAVLYNRNSKRVNTYSTTIYDKEVRNSMIYAGVFVPIVYYLLNVDMGIEVNVNKSTFDRLGIGDRVQVARYSNGKYKLEAIL
jgi:hypothetical protein